MNDYKSDKFYFCKEGNSAFGNLSPAKNGPHKS